MSTQLLCTVPRYYTGYNIGTTLHRYILYASWPVKSLTQIDSELMDWLFVVVVV